MREGDRLINASLIGEDGTVLLFSDSGKVARFAARAARGMGRTAAGVRGMKFKNDSEHVVSMLALSESESQSPILIAADNGRGKRTNAAEFAIKGRGGQGGHRPAIKKQKQGRENCRRDFGRRRR